MAMNVGSDAGEEDQVVSTINTTPLVDVMLVLLIIFLITIPVVTTSIPVTLPKERNEIRETKPENIILSVDAKGGIYWTDPRRRRGRLQLGRQDHLRGPARRYREGRLHHGAAPARRLAPNARELRYG